MVGVWFTLVPAALMAVLIWQRVPLEVWLACAPFWCAMIYGLHCLGLFSLRIHRQMNREECVITDRRVLCRSKKKIVEHIVAPEDVIFLAQGRDGCATVVIGSLTAAYQQAKRRPRNFSLANCMGFQLRAIADPTRVMDVLHTLRPTYREEAESHV